MVAAPPHGGTGGPGLAAKTVDVEQRRGVAASRPDLPLQPFDERLVDGVRLFQRRQMSAAGNDDKPRARNRRRNLAREFGRRRLVALADQHQRLARNRRKAGPRIRTADDRLLLAQISVEPGLLDHLHHDAFQRRVVMPVAMHVERISEIGNFGEAAGLGLRHQDMTPLGLLGRVGARAGVEQRELDDALAATGA